MTKGCSKGRPFGVLSAFARSLKQGRPITAGTLSAPDSDAVVAPSSRGAGANERADAYARVNDP